jgi:2-polyprenyl-6-methoxyphenol hydroxylase-like FAD-dependent oxidoreductase
VVVLDRDPGPPARGPWLRRGVMQFHQAHTFRRQVVDVLGAELPEVLDALTAAGADMATDDRGRPAGLLCSRMTFDRILRDCATRLANITLAAGHVDEVIRDRGHAVGVKVNGRTLAADLVVDASGRASRFTRALRRPAEGGDCGAAYVTRQYQLHRNASIPPINTPFGLVLGYPAYWALAYLQDNRTCSITLVHDGSDKRLRLLRHDDVFDDAVRAIPRLAEWIEPSRSQVISSALPGGRLHNSYRGQLDDGGRPVLPGLVSVGDAVCTTTPLAGRGVALALMQARQLVRTLDQAPDDIVGATMEFDRWCDRNIRPWFDDHLYTDADRMRRWSGGDVDLHRRLPSDLIVAAAEADPALKHIVGPYASMDALPATLALAEPRARAMFAEGWRPPVPAGPTRDELSEVVSRTRAAA